MPEPPDHNEPTVSAGPSRAVDLDYSTLGRLVETEAKDLYETVGMVHDQLENLIRSQDRTPAGEIRYDEPEVLRSPGELVARLDGIGQSAHRLARHLQALVELRVGGDQDASRRTDAGAEPADDGAPSGAMPALEPDPGRWGAAELPRFLTAKEAAAHLRVSVWAVYDAVKAGDLSAVRVGRAIRIPRDALAGLVPGTSTDLTDG